ncbi:hypothetical protein BGX27_009196 [Mortierella sp. AM989]|nr:hypothetical protein BGX27_009196 [Mortierella sp. AM989]
MFSRSLAAVFLSFGLLISSIQADTLEFASPRPNSKLSTGQIVPITYKVHHNGMAKLLWAKVNLLTEDGYDSGMGTFSNTVRSEWQDSLSVSLKLKIPENLTPGKYKIHVYGSTEQPCKDSVDMTERCEGILSETLPVVIRKATHATLKKNPKSSNDGEKDHGILGLSLPKRSLYSKRNLESHGPSEYLLQDGSIDTKKMLYFFSLI